MISYIIRRLLYLVPIVFGVILVTFLLFNIIQGDRAAMLAGKSATEETIQDIRHEYGWDKPKAEQFLLHVKNMICFEFGDSFDSKEAVIDKIKRGIGPTLSLTVPMFIGSLFISVSIALGLSFIRGTVWDVLAVIVCVAGMSLPILSFIMFGQYFIANKWDLLPVMYWPGESLAIALILPVSIGIIATLGVNVRFYRTVMLDEIRNDYIRTAFAKGLSTPKVLFKHVLKNAMIPIITNVVMAIPYLFLGSILLESFFGIPGLGSIIIEAIRSRDDRVIMAMTYMGAILVVMLNLVADICYALVDPRVSVD